MSAVTVIIVSYESAARLHACLGSLPDPGLQIILVDNASSDGSAELARRFCPPALILENAKNLGFAAAVNQALRRATGEYALLLNPDAALLPGALEAMICFLQAHSQAAAVGPRQYIDHSLAWQWSILPQPPHWSLLLARRGSFQRLPPVRRRLEALWTANRAVWRGDAPCQAAALSGACLLLRRASLDAIGGLDEGYFLFYEDVDLALRLRRAGWQIYALPAAGVIHAGMGSVRSLPAAGRARLLASGRRYLQLHGDPFSRLLWAVLVWKTRRGENAPPGLPAESPLVAASYHLPGQIRPPPGPMWVEISLDASFASAAAGVLHSPEDALPPALQELAAGLSIHWRIAPKITDGK
jgi:hypothetical protein